MTPPHVWLNVQRWFFLMGSSAEGENVPLKVQTPDVKNVTTALFGVIASQMLQEPAVSPSGPVPQLS